MASSSRGKGWWWGWGGRSTAEKEVGGSDAAARQQAERARSLEMVRTPKELRKSTIAPMAGVTTVQASSGGEKSAYLMSGYLETKRKRALTSKWKRAFYALSDGFLGYWEDERRFLDKAWPKRTVDLQDCSLAMMGDSAKKGFCFGIFHPDRDPLVLSCPDEEARREWMAGVKLVLGLQDDTVSFRDFSILNSIGKGAYGEVFRVRKVDSGEVYAMKVVSKESIVNQKEKDDFEKELQRRKHLQGIIDVDAALQAHWTVESLQAERRALQVVDHPFIVKLHFAFRTIDRFILVMDYVRGGDLLSLLASKQRLPEPWAAFYAAEVILAIEYLHEMRILFRDLKPENVLLDELGHVKLTDFGHSKQATSLQDRSFSLVGSPFYMAPEIILGVGHGQEADWWSLGILIFEMLVGAPPFYDKNSNSAYKRLLTESIEYPHEVSSSARELLARLLQADSTRRFGGGVVEVQAGESKAAAVGRKWSCAWLAQVDWVELLKRQVDPPHKPGRRRRPRQHEAFVDF